MSSYISIKNNNSNLGIFSKVACNTERKYDCDNNDHYRRKKPVCLLLVCISLRTTGSHFSLFYTFLGAFDLGVGISNPALKIDRYDSLCLSRRMCQHNLRVEVMSDLLRYFYCQDIFLAIICGLVNTEFHKLITSVLLI